MPIETNSKITLIAKALVLLGEEPIVSLSDNRYGATVGSNMFELVYEAELQSNRWRFAMKKGALSLLVGVPLNQWQNAFQLPADMLIPIGVFPPVPYEIYADRIYTNASIVELDYMFKPEVTSCPAYFCLLLTYALARNMAKPITESDTTAQKWEREYIRQKAIAQFADAQGRPSQRIFSSPFTDVR